MRVARFFDTNVLLYAYDLNAPKKRAVALVYVRRAWENPGETAISVQVLQELHVNLTRRGASPAEAAAIVKDYAAWPVQENSLPVLLEALREQARWKISLWDASILAAAKASGATVLLTEDLNHGQDYGGIRAVNPFAGNL